MYNFIPSIDHHFLVGFQSNIVIKLEKEISTLRAANSKLNQRLGGVEAVDSSFERSLSDSELVLSEPKINTRYYQIDPRFAPTFYYITNVSRCYYVHCTMNIFRSEFNIFSLGLIFSQQVTIVICGKL